MENQSYLKNLLYLRRELETRIDNEIEEILRGRPDRKKLESSLQYVLEQSSAFKEVE